MRVSISTAPNLDEGPLGQFVATLTLPDGTMFTDSAEIQLLPQIETGTNSSPRSVPDYQIIDVRQFPQSDQEISWSDVAGSVEMDDGWTRDDVAALAVHQPTEDARSHKIIFYLNADNDSLIQAEKRITASRNETAVEATRQYHRTLQCYHLYQLATSAIQADNTIAVDEYKKYRSELIRLNETLLYAQKEFGEVRDDDEES